MYPSMIEVSPLLVVVEMEVLILELSSSCVDIEILEDFLVWEPSKDLFLVDRFATAKISSLTHVGNSRNWRVVKECKESACS